MDNNLYGQTGEILAEQLKLIVYKLTVVMAFFAIIVIIMIAIAYIIKSHKSNIKNQNNKDVYNNNTRQTNYITTTRMITGLKTMGMNEKEINNFILYVETGEEKYLSKF